MRKIVICILLTTLAVSMIGCNELAGDSENNTENTERIESTDTTLEDSQTEEVSVKKVKFVTDLYEGARIPKARNIKDAPNAELIYEDENYAYYFEYTRAAEIRVRYEDGSKENLKEALAAGTMKISDLTEWNWGVFVCDKSLKEGEEAELYNIVKEEGGGADQVREIFFEDATYKYYFNTADSCVTFAYYTDGTRVRIDDALATGRITIADLDANGIEYSKMAK